MSLMGVEEDGLQALQIAVVGSPIAPNHEVTPVGGQASRP